MADLTDITAYLMHAAALAVYPSGIGQPSVANMDIRIFEGWPNAAQLDLDLGGKMLGGIPPMPITRPGGPVANVSVFPMLGSNVEPFQILDNTYTQIAPVIHMALTLTGAPGNTVTPPTVTIASQPTAGEYLTIIADRAHIYSATGATTVSIISQLVTLALVDYPGTTSTATSITIPALFDFAVRQGAPGTLGKVTHRQAQEIMITTWAPNHTARGVIAAAIDVALKQKVVVALPDTTSAKFCFNRTNTIDEQSVDTVYRRDLIYTAEYATLQTFTGYVITSTTLQIQGGNWGVTTAPPIYAFQDRPGPPFPLPNSFAR